MKRKTRDGLVGAAVTVLAGLGLLLAGCSTTAPGTAAGTASPQKSTATAQGGAQLWALNCGHCHNIRSPGSYSDAQWDVAMLHMRVRANLTAEEHKQILAFLKSAR